MLNDSRIMEERRRGIWEKCSFTATFYANILVNGESGKPNHKSIFGVEFNKVNNLIIFGEMTLIQGKISSQGNYRMFVGYLQSHLDDSYHAKIRQAIKQRGLFLMNEDYETWF
jgi:hypothetical protein